MTERSLVPVPRSQVAKRPGPSVADLPEYLTWEEARSIIEAATNQRDRLLMETLWQTGGRATEALALRMGDILYPVNLRLPNRKRRTPQDKVCYVSPELIAELLGYGSQNGLGSTDRVFPIQKRRLEMIVRAAATKAGVYKLWNRHGAAGGETRPAWTHLFRHGAAVHLIEQTGGRLDVVQDQLGHSDLNTTKRYLRLSDADKRRLFREVRY